MGVSQKVRKSGHVTYLEKAKSMGDILIVAVNSDSSVKKLKGSKRPINSLNKRLLVLSALGMVDFVVPFSQDTPIELIKAITPNILVKGGDYKAKDIIGYNHVIKHNGSVKVINFVEGCSTTNILSHLLF